MGPITFGISSPKGPQLLSSSYFQVAVTFGQLIKICEQPIPRNSLNEVKMYCLIIMKGIFLISSKVENKLNLRYKYVDFRP